MTKGAICRSQLAQAGSLMQARHKSMDPILVIAAFDYHEARIVLTSLSVGIAIRQQRSTQAVGRANVAIGCQDRSSVMIVLTSLVIEH